MDDYINRDSFLTDMAKIHCTNCTRRKNANGKIVYEIGDAPCRACKIGDMLDCVDDYPAADVRENVPAEWILDDDDDYYELWKCSHCGKGIFDYRYDFCPNCGADMAGVKK